MKAGANISGRMCEDCEPFLLPQRRRLLCHAAESQRLALAVGLRNSAKLEGEMASGWIS